MNKLIVFTSPSCGGKDTISSILVNKYNYSFVISHTSRPIRSCESEGNPYYFIAKEKFLEMISNHEFIENREYHTDYQGQKDIWYYGIAKNSIDLTKNSYICVVDLQGLIELKQYFREDIISFYLNVDENTRKKRCIKRGDYDTTEWNRRNADDKIKFSSELVNKEVDYIIDNYDLDKCVAEIERCINAEN